MKKEVVAEAFQRVFGIQMPGNTLERELCLSQVREVVVSRDRKFREAQGNRSGIPEHWSEAAQKAVWPVLEQELEEAAGQSGAADALARKAGYEPIAILAREGVSAD